MGLLIYYIVSKRETWGTIGIIDIVSKGRGIIDILYQRKRAGGYTIHGKVVLKLSLASKDMSTTTFLQNIQIYECDD